ncbi:MAG: 3-oxoadipate enol-lactonase [Casimicrobiaceae bacterium]
MTAYFVDVDGGRLRYRLDGGTNTPVLVLSNSLGTNLSMWEPQMGELTRGFRVLRYDTRGHGESSVTPGPYSIERLGRDVVALLDRLGIDRAHFCGLSLGGMTGMWLAIHAPTRLSRLALCNTAAHMPPADLWNGRIDQVRGGGMEAIVAPVLARWFTPDFLARSPDIAASVRQMVLATPADGYIACCAAIRDMDQREAIAGISAPTLVIAGTHDPATPPADGRFIADHIAGARYVELPAAHLSNIEAGRDFTAALLNFL